MQMFVLPHDFRGMLTHKHICGLRTVQPCVHTAATISQNNQLHCKVPDPLLRVVSETTQALSNTLTALGTLQPTVFGMSTASSSGV